MKHEDYQKAIWISRLAIKLTTEKKADFLTKECGEDAELRRLVESLLEEQNSELLRADPPSYQIFEAVEKDIPDKPSEIYPVISGDASRQFGNYKIIHKIGAGGMGDVYLAQDIKLNRKVALKILHDKFTSDPLYLKRFKLEVRAVSALNHPYILTIFEFGQNEQGLQFIASEYIEGQTLNKFYANEKPDLSRKLDILIQISSALSAAHEAGIIHRDVKPENIIVRPDGYVKVLDFGLAKLIEKKHGAASDMEIATITLFHTNPGTIIGTPSYMAPEQAKGTEVDARTDIFSFGVVIYETVSGHLPFTGNSALEIIGAILHTEPEPLNEMEVPSEIKRIVEKALQKNPDERYQTMKDLLIDLKEVRRELDFRHKFEQKFQSDATLSKKQDNTTNGATETQSINPPQKTSKMPSARRFSNFLIFLFIAFAAAAGFAIWRAAGGLGTQTAAIDKALTGSFKSYQITNWANAAGELSSTAAFSPDGKFVAFGSTETGTTSIWVRQTDKGDAIRVTKDDFYNRYPVWSPNSDEIVYYSKRGGTHGLWRVSLMGGQTQLIAENVDSESKPRLWSKSGKIYFQGNNNLFAAESGEVRPVTDFPQTGMPVRIIKISPDESQIAFLSIEDDNWKIKIKPLSGNAQPTEIINSKKPIDNLVWQPDGKGILYSQKTEEFFQIFSANLSGGGNTFQISSGDNDSFIQDVSSDGARILFSTVTETSDLWRIETENAKESLTAAQMEAELWADVSPDSSMVAYQSIKNLRQGGNLLNGSIIMQPITKDARSLRLAEDGFLPQWSPDGKTIAFLKLANLKLEIWRVAATGDQLKRISAGGIQGLIYSLSPYLQLQVKHLSWSPNSSALAFPSEMEGISNIWLVSADGSSNQRKLTANEDGELRFYCPLWTSDAKRIAYAGETKKRDSEGKIKYSLWFYDTGTNAQQKLLETFDTVRLLGWNKKEDELVFAVKKNDPSFTLTPPETIVQAVSVKTGGQRRLTILKDAYFYNIYLSPDGTAIAYTSRAGGQDDVWVSPLEGPPRRLTGNNDSRLYFSSLAWSPDGKSIYFGKQTRFTLLSMLVNQKTKEIKNADSTQ
jgi:serine/threonine protein kinase/Tol biopolymer transport system component